MKHKINTLLFNLECEHDLAIAFMYGYGENVGGGEQGVDEEALVESIQEHRKREPKCNVCLLIKQAKKESRRLK